jgi:NTE family protein
MGAGTAARTAFVLAGGGSFGAVQAGMLRALLAHRVTPDLIVGSSVGAINGAYLAGSPSANGVARLEAIWRGLRRHEVFPVGLRSLFGLLGRRNFTVDPRGVRRLLEDNLPYRRLEDAAVPLHVVATDVLGGAVVRLSSGPVIDAVLASCAIPAAFPPVRIGAQYLMDGAVASNTPIRTAIELGAARLVVLPTGYACALQSPPRGALALMLHAITLLTARQLASDLERYGCAADIITVPPLCPLVVSPYDFSRAAELIERAAAQTQRWLIEGGMHKRGAPSALRAAAAEALPA